MKRYFSNTIYGLLTVMTAAIVLLVSCKKDSDGSNFSKPDGNPAYVAISVDSAANGAVIYVTGSGLGDMRTIIFDKENVPARITPTLNTGNSIIFNVPDTAKGGNQNIVLTNSLGKSITIPFKVLAYAKLSAASPSLDFATGSELTLTGVNLDDVTDVKLTGTDDHATIISKDKTKLVITMPSTTKSRATLSITNLTGLSVSTLEFVSVANARTVYSDQLDNGFQNWGWGIDNVNFSNGSDKICGSYSLDCGWTGSWGGVQLGGGYVDLTGMTYLTFYARGGAANTQYQLWLDWGPSIIFTVPKNTWTYYRYKLSDFASGKTDVSNFTWQIMGDPVDGVYFDDVMFIK